LTQLRQSRQRGFSADITTPSSETLIASAGQTRRTSVPCSACRRRHRRRRLGAIDVVDKDHRVAFVRGALAARSDTGATADATLRIDEHRLFHRTLFSPRSTTPFSLPAHDRQLPRMNLFDSRGARLELGIFDTDRARDSSVDYTPTVRPSDTE
jgi:hypothetical protein